MAFIQATWNDIKGHVLINVHQIVAVYSDMGSTVIRTTDAEGQYTVTEDYEDILTKIELAQAFASNGPR